MSDDTIGRFKRVQPDLGSSIGYLQAGMKEDGSIILTCGKAYSIMIWSTSMVLCLALIWVSLSDSSPLPSPIFYPLLAIPWILGILMLSAVPHLRRPLPWVKIDPTLRQITVYGGFPRWRPREVIPIEDIRLFLAHTIAWTDHRESSIWVVVNSRSAYSAVSATGSLPPDSATKFLGYVCGKTAVHITEREPALGPLAWGGPIFKPKHGKHVNIERILNKGDILYNPESPVVPD